MEVWVLEWSYPYDTETNVTLWSTKEEAQKKACTEIQARIDSDWDMDEETQKDYAENIDDKITRKKYAEAMSLWADYQDNYNDDHAQYWTVYSREVLTGSLPGPAPTIVAVNYKSSTPGATCRGPCKNFNDYAYADQPDGTYVCFQCNTFQHIFGTKP